MKGHRIRYARNAPRSTLIGRQADILAESARIVVGGPQRVADGVVPAEAVAAGVAGHVMGHHQPVALAELRYTPAPDLGHRTGDLMSQHQPARAGCDTTP